MAILERLPDITAPASAGARLQTDLGGLLGALNALQPQNAASPLAGLFSAFAELHTRLDIDPATLTGGLQGAVQSISGALPANALAYVEALDSAYQQAAGLLGESEIARQVGEGQSLNAVAQAVIDEALGLFATHIDELAGNLIDAGRLEELRQALSLIQSLEDDFAGHQAELLPFLSSHLLGVAPDLLAAPLAHVQTALDLLGPISDAPAETLAAPRRAALAAYAALLEAVDALNPADAAGYAAITLQLDALQAADALLIPALNTLYSQLDGAIAHYGWDTLFPVYVDLLAALDIGIIPTVDDVVLLLESMISDLLAGLLSVFDGDDLRGRIELLNRTLHDAVLGSPLGQVKQTIEAFLLRIRQAIEAVPTEDVQRVVNEMLGKVQSAIAQLNLDQLQQQIEQVFTSIDEFVNNNLNTTVRENIRTALAALSAQLNNLPLTNLLNDLNGALGQVQNLIGELESALQGQLDDLKALLQQAEALSFKPVSNAVIGEIDELKGRLAAINPNALSDAEKLAIIGALAFLEAIDLETQVISGLKSGYHSAENEVRALFNQIVAALNQLTAKIALFDPTAILQPINAALDAANHLLEQVNARSLLGPLYAQIDTLQGMLQAVAPGRLLDPLQAAYDQAASLLNRLDPAQWVAPLNDLYAQIDRLISVVDITPVLEDLDSKQRQLLGQARAAILNGFDSLNLPAPLAGFWAEMRPLLELVTEAVFGDPDTQLREIGLAINARVRLGTLFGPLDELFLRLVTMVESVPADSLTAVMNAIRQSIGVGLELLDPQALISALRAGYGRLQELAPANLLAQTAGLPAAKALFAGKVELAPPSRAGDIATVSARFDAVGSVVTPGASGSQYAQLQAAHARLLDDLRRRINQLDHTQASLHYAAVRSNLDRVLPDFLRQPAPLTHADILAGLHAMRPSRKVAPVEALFTHFLQQLAPYESAIEPAVNGFFATLREIMLLLSPLSLRDGVASIYAAVRQKTHILDPAQLAAAINALLDPIKAAVQALSPAALKAKIDAGFANAVQTVNVTLKGVLDDLVGVIDGQLRTLRAALHVVLDQLKASLAAALDSLKRLLQQIEALVFVEILERLGKVIDNLGVSFDQELERVRNAFDEMLHAVPLGGSQAAGEGLAL